MHALPTVTAQAVIPTGAKPELTDIAMETATIHPAGLVAGISLHFATLEAAVTWWHDLGDSLVAEALRRRNAVTALREMDETLRKVGAR